MKKYFVYFVTDANDKIVKIVNLQYKRAERIANKIPDSIIYGVNKFMVQPHKMQRFEALQVGDIYTDDYTDFF